MQPTFLGSFPLPQPRRSELAKETEVLQASCVDRGHVATRRLSGRAPSAALLGQGDMEGARPCMCVCVFPEAVMTKFQSRVLELPVPGHTEVK